MSDHHTMASVTAIRTQAALTVAMCDQLLADLNKAPAFQAPDESSDTLDYREGRRPSARLSDRGRRVAEQFLRAGFTDEATGSFMDVSPWGIGQFRRRLGLPYGHRQQR